MAPRATALVVGLGLGLALALGPGLLGCWGGEPPRLRCGVTPPEPMVACPLEAALVAHLRERWHLSPRATITATCTPGRFGGAGWLIEARVADGASRAGARFVLQPSCGALTDAALRAGELPEARHELVDLDGDGLDEVVTHRDVAEAHGRSTNLEVLRVGGGRLVRAGRVRVAYVGVDPELPGPGEVTCTGAARFAPHPDGGWLVEITSTRTAPSSLCLADGVHRLELGAAGLRRR
ncbi:MAG: hypothetical protein HS111_04075 [Kofleriaceae bacterium]|nr:hypothetical protein [Kofleriaceae bacterium]MCL4224517.1 hypothetical protein [Myxococcales bacterium]